MDQSEQYLNSLTQYLNKKVIQLLIISLSFLSFSFLSLSFSSPCYSFFLHYFNLYLSGFPFQLLTQYSLHRNYIFLICNGILVLLAKTSGFINILSPSVDSDLNDHSVLINGDSLQSSKESLMIEKEQVSVEYLDEEHEPAGIVNFNTKLGGEEKQEETEKGSSGFIIQEEKEEEEEEEEEEDGNDDELLNREELNKKFDDFIRRMKQEIRIEAQHQLVIV
ncbi:uncharacterized protein LOC132308356 [Cornus florida]|uniref:uncharacterized protein LOC132308356 n=1 Tax=Cornus florida TaxID=4283 RepID=UPI00289827B6|nr:uncharacterized protein LOC132308356 [Cornus florida]